MPLFDALYNFGRWLTRNADEAEDLVQETYAKALRGWETFKPGTDLRAWMFRIMKNAFLNSRTGLREQMTDSVDVTDEHVHPPTEWTPEDAALATADRDRVREALSALSPEYREVLLLCDVEEMKYREIGTALGIPIGTVMSRISRARQALREQLKTRTMPVR